MLKRELELVLKNKKTKIILLFLFLLTMADLGLAWWQCFGLWLPVKLTKPTMIWHPAIGAFLSASTEGHITQMLYLWILPLYFLILYCDLPLLECQKGYHNILYTKTQKKQYLKIRLGSSFAFCFVIVFATLVINYILAIILFWGGKNFRGNSITDYPDHIIYTISMKNPYIIYMVYIIVAAIIAGGCGMVCMSLSFVMKQYKYLYLLCFLLWYLQIIAPNSLTYVIQPFIEYDIDYILPAAVVFLVIWWGIVIFSYRYRVRKDEI